MRDRARRKSANLVRHLDDRHPTTVLLLARHAPGGRPDATAATLTRADETGLMLTLALPDGTAELRLALPDDGSVPLTSLKRQTASGEHVQHGTAKHQRRSASAPTGITWPGDLP